MSNFANAIESGLDAVRDIAGVEGTYHRSSDWTTITAVPAESRFTFTDTTGSVLRAQTRDFIVESDSLRLTGTLVTPQSGDRFKERRARDIAIYEVMRPAGTDVEWRYVDAGRTRIRIHCRLIGTENPS